MLGFEFDKPESVFYEKYRRQLKSTLAVCIIVLSHGISSGWVSPMLLQLQSNDSPLSFSISVEEASWIGALLFAGGITGKLVFGCLIDLIGRKMCIYLLAFPHTMFWILVYYANGVFCLYAARLLAGLTGGALLLVIPLFVSEIADPKIRGTLGSLLSFLQNIGILLGYIVAAHVPYFIIPKVVGVLPVLYLILATQYPETPQHLIRKGLNDKAEKSFQYYRNAPTVENKDQEEKFISQFVDVEKSSENNSSQKDKKASLHDFCTPRSLKPLLSGAVLMFLLHFTGIVAIQNYSSMIFAETHSKIDPNTNTIVIGIVQIIGSCCTTNLVDKHGRKVLLLLSTSGMCLGFTAIGVYSYLVKLEMDLSSFTWLPVVALSFVIFTANIGILSLVFVVLVEILPPKIRALGTTFCLLLASSFGFIVLKIFPVFMATVGLYSVMGVCAGVSIFGFLYISIFLKETKGKCLDDDRNYDL